MKQKIFLMAALVIGGSLIFFMVNQDKNVAGYNSSDDQKSEIFLNKISETDPNMLKQNNDEHDTIVIEDKGTLYEMFKLNKDIPSEFEVERMEVNYFPITNKGHSSSPVKNNKQLKYKIDNIKDLGCGWYNADDDLVERRVVDGPDLLEINIDEIYNIKVSSDVEIDNDILSAAGFSIEDEYIASYSENIKVPENQRIEINIYKAYEKKSFDLLKKKSSKNDEYEHSGWVYKPVGLYVEKILYKK